MSKINSIKEKVLNFQKNGASKSEITKFIKAELNVKDSRARVIRREICGDDNEEESGITIENNQKTCHIKSNNNDVQTLDELLVTCKVDITVWEVDKYTIKKNDVIVRSEGEQSIVPRFSIEVWLKRKSFVSGKELLDDFKEKAEKHAPKKFIITKPNSKKEYLYVPSIYDLHLAKLVWGREVGYEDYDLNIASDVFRRAIEDSLAKSPTDKIEKMLFPIGNDFFQFDNEASETTAGTYVDSDSRWQKMFMRGCELMVESIEKLSQIAPTDVIVCAGNHDNLSSQYLGYYLQAWFRNHKYVTINNEPTPRKYYKFGQVLLGFCHGDAGKLNDLPLVMASECKKDWGDTKFREFMTGHKHQETVKEIKGVKVRTISSLTGTDFWHSKNMYVGNIRASESFLYHKENGLEAVYYFNL
jgi:hypothetical protein